MKVYVDYYGVRNFVAKDAGLLFSEVGINQAGHDMSLKGCILKRDQTERVDVEVIFRFGQKGSVSMVSGEVGEDWVRRLKSLFKVSRETEGMAVRVIVPRLDWEDSGSVGFCFDKFTVVEDDDGFTAGRVLYDEQGVSSRFEERLKVGEQMFSYGDYDEKKVVKAWGFDGW